MSRSTATRSNSRPSLWCRLKSLLIADVPEDIAICEFDCRKSQCTYGEWATCQRRINLQALPSQKAPIAPTGKAGKLVCADIGTTRGRDRT